MNKRRDVQNKLALKRLVSIAVLVVYLPFQVHANPTGPTLVSGSALISNPSANVMQVVNTPGTIINWNDFSIAGGETTRFVQLNAASAILNRVTGGDPSSLLGRLESNGRVFLVNPNGIVFGGSSVVDVAGLIASTRNITNDNFTNGFYLFSDPGQGTVTVQNGAQILTAGTGGQVWLIGNEVNTQAGSHIETPQGQVVMAATQSVTVGTSDLGAMSFHVQTDAENTISAMGEIIAQRGAAGFFADSINFGGKVLARSTTEGKGQITAQATSGINVGMDARLDVSADGNTEAGAIHLEAARTIAVHPASEVLAESLAGQGGTILLKAYQIDLPAPRHADDWEATFFNESVQSVRAFGINADRDGTVIVEETGSFNYVTTPIEDASVQNVNTQLQFTDPCCAREEIGWQSGLAGDGSILYYIVRYPNNPASIFLPQTQETQQEFLLIRDGQTTSLGALVPNAPPGQINYVMDIVGLSKGGWVVLSNDYVDGGHTQEQIVRIITADGSVGATWSPGNESLLSMAPLPSGGVWIRKLDFDNVELDSRVYSASGVELTGDARTAALGTVRAVDVARHRNASADGGRFEHRVVSDIYLNPEENNDRIYTYTYDLVRGIDELDTLQVSRIEEIGNKLIVDQSVWTVLSSSAGSVTWKNEYEFTRDLGLTSVIFHEPRTGFGGDGALVASGNQSDQGLETTASTTTYFTETDDPGFLVSWINSLNVPSDDGHFLPPYDTSSTVNNNAYLRERTWDSSLSRLTRTPLALPDAASSVTGNVGQSAAFDTRPGLATNTDVALPPTPTPTPTPPAPPVVDDNTPPTVVTGTGAGASFGGISGCNSAVCADNVRQAGLVIDALRAAQAVSGSSGNANLVPGELLSSRPSSGGFDDNLAALAVMELARAANREVPTGDQALGVAQLMRDNGELRRLVNGSVFSPEQTPQQRYEAVQQWLRTEEIEQAVGSSGEDATVREEVRLVHMLANMSTEEEVDAFYQQVVMPMQFGQ